MVDVVDTVNAVKSALDDFYASLKNEWKACFNRIGRELPKSNGLASRPMK